MTLLLKTNALISRCDAGRQRCEMQLHSGEQRRQVLLGEITELRQQIQALRQLIELEQPQGHLDRAQLFLRQRRLAVIRRQIQAMALQKNTLKQELMELGRQQEEVSSRRLHWQRQEEKYQQLASRQRKARRLARLRQEETETQEIITWKS